jgi:F5/8 type C domain
VPSGETVPSESAQSSQPAPVGVPGPAPAPVTSNAGEVPPHPRRAVLEWFWRGQAIRTVKRSVLATADRTEPLAQRARMAAELGRRAVEPPEPFPAGNVEALACDLFRQSAYWALRALASSRFNSASDVGEPRAGLALEPWTAVSESVLLRAAGTAENLSTLRKAVDDASFVSFAELPRDEQIRLAKVLRKFADKLLSELEIPARTLDVLWLQRLWRVGVILALLGGILIAVLWLGDRAENRRDMALGKAWRASSSYGVGGCRSPDQECPDSPAYFLHTQEEDRPWVEFDLGQPRSVSAVRIINRKDCCAERAVPMIIEISRDQHKWRQVARRADTFSSWLAEFRPVQARWVRVRVDRVSLLHLARVRILE